MSILDDLRKLFSRQQVPANPAYQEYCEAKETNATDIRRFRGYIKQYSDQLEALTAQGRGPADPAYQSAMESLQRFRYSLYEAELTADFIRENTQQDKEYRNQQLNSFAEELQKLLPENTNYRFHGTPIYFAKEILSKGCISSTADRFDGFIKSTDGHNEVSVSDIDSLSRTVSWFMDMTAYARCLPCGCLFVLRADGQTAEQHSRSVMNAVDFKSEPERLVAVISTPENQKNLQSWLQSIDLNSNLAYTFDSYISEIQKNQSLSPASIKPPLSAQVSSAAVRAAIQQAGYIPQNREDRSNGHIL